MISALKSINGYVFAVLVIAGVVGALAALPYLLAIASANPQLTNGPRPPLALIVGVTAVQSAAMLTLVVGAGMLLASRTGLSAPILHHQFGSAAPASAAALLGPALVWGLGTGALLVLADLLFFARTLPATFHPLFHIPLWKRLLAGVLYGGVTEELITRLFLVSLLAWGVGRFWRAPDGLPAPGAFWCAILGSALLFGALHLPATAALAPLSPTLVLRALLLNGLAGIVFGYLYWTRGLEAAMLAHASAHLVLQGPGFALIRTAL